MEKQSRKRKSYTPEEYAIKLRGLTLLMQAVDKLHPDRNQWDIEGDWNGTGVIHFVDGRNQSLFADYKDFDCRTIKLVNFGRPAARLTFFKKHRYWVLKNADLTREEKTTRITSYINELIVKKEILLDKTDRLTGMALSDAKGQLGLMREEINAWEKVLHNVDSFDMAVSNYQRDYHYLTLNYKYRATDQEQEYKNGQEHLLNPQRDNRGVITQQRFNIVFIDLREISREHPHQHKEIENFLNNFTLVSQTGKQQLYARLKPLDEVTTFENAAPTVSEAVKIDRDPTLFDQAY